MTPNLFLGGLLIGAIIAPGLAIVSLVVKIVKDHFIEDSKWGKRK